MSQLNTLRPRPNRRHFADETFKRIFLNENGRISIKISLKFDPKGPINNIPALVQIMAWRRPGDKPLSEAMMVSLLTHICVTRPQWVKWVGWMTLVGFHYVDVIMGAMVSQITRFTIVYSTVYSSANQSKHESSASLAFVRGIHRWLVNSPHKRPVTRKVFPLDGVIMDILFCFSKQLTAKKIGVMQTKFSSSFPSKNSSVFWSMCHRMSPLGV